MNDTYRAGLIALAILGLALTLMTYFSSHYLPTGRHPDTNRIRCEDEQGGVYIDNVCFEKAAVRWISLDGKDNIRSIAK